MRSSSFLFFLCLIFAVGNCIVDKIDAFYDKISDAYTEIHEKISNVQEKISNIQEQISDSLDHASDIYDSVTDGFKIHGLNGCESTSVPRVQKEKVGEMFYSFKLNEKNGYIVEKGLVNDYVKIPLKKHQYGWYYRNFHAEGAEDLGNYFQCCFFCVFFFRVTEFLRFFLRLKFKYLLVRPESSAGGKNF